MIPLPALPAWLSPTRMVMLLMLVAMLVSAGAVVVQTLRLETAKTKQALAETQTKAATDREADTAARWQSKADGLAADLLQCQQQWADLSGDMQSATAEAHAEKQKAAKLAAEFAARFEARSLQCGAALQQAETACPELADY